MRRQLILAASAVALLSGAGPALAQEPQRLTAGETVAGEIDEGDSQVAAEGYRFDSYALEARSGQRFKAVLRSEAFDAVLELLGPDGSEEPLAFDDDGFGEGTDARLRFTALQDGVHILRARTLLGDQAGAYTLALTERPAAPRSARPSGIRLDQTVRGELTDGDPETEEGVVFDSFSFRAGPSDRFLISLDSDSFDPVVRVGRETGQGFAELAINDDGVNAGLNSRLLFVAPESGRYILQVASVSAGETGSYSLTLASGPEPLAAEPISIGQTVRGTLSESDGANAAGTSADAWRFAGRQGQRVRIDMNSTDFDAFLELFDPQGASLATDDDGGAEGMNSRLIHTLPRDGDYVIEARAFASATGAYELSLTEMQPEGPPQELAFGSVLEGEIGDEDSRDDQDRAFDGYSFTGMGGQRIQAVMRSGDFDTYLQLGAAGEGFTPLASDDDGLGQGTDSRLNFTLPDDGTYVLRASPLGSEGKGLYSLELIDRGPEPQPGSLLVGATARGTLAEADATADDNSFYDAYRLTLKADEKLVLTMVSNEVDSYLVIGRAPEGADFEVLAEDDDGLSDTNAKLEWTAPSDGVYEVRAGTFQQGQTGAYALTVEKQP